jgi:hypothetical protein
MVWLVRSLAGFRGIGHVPHDDAATVSSRQCHLTVTTKWDDQLVAWYAGWERRVSPVLGVRARIRLMPDVGSRRQGKALNGSKAWRSPASGAMRWISVVLLVVSVACEPTDREQVGRFVEGVSKAILIVNDVAGRQLNIAVLNVENRNDVYNWEAELGHPWGPSNETKRLAALADLLKEHFPQWSVVAMQELYYERDRVFGLNPLWYVELDDKWINSCGSRAQGGHAADCFGAYLGTALRKQWRGVGIVADDGVWISSRGPPCTQSVRHICRSRYLPVCVTPFASPASKQITALGRSDLRLSIERSREFVFVTDCRASSFPFGQHTSRQGLIKIELGRS